MNTNGNNIQILTNNGSLSFILDNSYPMQALNGITASDFDGNGSVDLVGICSATNQIKFLKTVLIALLLTIHFQIIQMIIPEILIME